MTDRDPLPELPSLEEMLYGTEDGDPVLWMWFDAWRFKDGAWVQEESPATLSATVRNIGKAEFDSRFGFLPPLPPEAFPPLPPEGA